MKITGVGRWWTPISMAMAGVHHRPQPVKKKSPVLADDEPAF